MRLATTALQQMIKGFVLNTHIHLVASPFRPISLSSANHWRDISYVLTIRTLFLDAAHSLACSCLALRDSLQWHARLEELYGTYKIYISINIKVSKRKRNIDSSNGVGFLSKSNARVCARVEQSKLPFFSATQWTNGVQNFQMMKSVCRISRARREREKERKIKIDFLVSVDLPLHILSQTE